ncbi:MAG: hypothetical protein ACLQU3_02620 [Limisphaerales bacterium]
MKMFRVLLTVGAAAVSLFCPRTMFAGTAATVVPQDRNDAALLRDLKGAPANVKTLILSFDQVADKYLQQQRVLLAQLKTATTAAERVAIRAQLQANRQAFLDELKTFRQELRADLQTLKGEITHSEVLRILEAAQDAAGPINARHKGRE